MIKKKSLKKLYLIKKMIPTNLIYVKSSFYLIVKLVTNKYYVNWFCYKFKSFFVFLNQPVNLIYSFLDYITSFLKPAIKNLELI